MVRFAAGIGFLLLERGLREVFVGRVESDALFLPSAHAENAWRR
jgi:hypothetical protein